MRIIFITHCLQIGGAEVLVTNYLIKMKELGHEVFLIQLYNTDSFLVEKLNVANIPIFTADKNFGRSFTQRVLCRLYRFFFRVKNVNNFIARISPDIVHCHTDLLLLHKVSFRPLFYTFHTDVDRTLQCLKRRYIFSLNKAIKNGMQIIALSKKIRQQALNFFPSATVTVIPNGVDVDFIKSQRYDRAEFLEGMGIPSDAFILGHVGRFHPVKNHEKVLEIFREVHKRNPNSYLILVGAIPSTGIGQELRSMENVRILGVCTNTAAVMSVFDCFILPSRREGFPLVLCEAQAKGIRCVCSDAVPDEAIVNDNCFKLGVEESGEKWADYVLGKFTESRNKTLDSINIKNAVEKHIAAYEKVSGSEGDSPR